MKELKIQIPDNQEIDWVASAEKKQIILKDKQLTYEDACKELFKDEYWYLNAYGTITGTSIIDELICDPNNATTKHQLECILAKNKLVNVAVYLNDGWKPNLEKDSGYCIVIDCFGDLRTDKCGVLCSYSLGKVMFKSVELAQKAIEILGEDTIKLALEPLY